MHKLFFLRKKRTTDKKAVAVPLGYHEVLIESLPHLFKNMGEIVSQIDEVDRWNAYYTMSKITGVDRETFLGQSCIPIDIDDVNDSDRLKVVETIASLLKIDVNKTGVVYSGHGVQIIIDTGVEWIDGSYFESTRANYAAMAKAINLALAERGLTGKTDTSVWSSGRLMRLPMTINRKDHKGLPDVNAELIQGNLEPQAFTISSFTAEDSGTADIGVIQRSTNVEEAGVLSCPFLQHCLENPEDINEPQWYAMLGILSFIPNTGHDLCHRYSSGHHNYSEVETNLKIKQISKCTGPRLCKSVETLWEGCLSCKKRVENAIATPLQLHSESYIKSQDTGFYIITECPNGSLKYTPDYAGLLKYFKQKFNYVTCAGTRQVHVYNKVQGYWTVMNELEVKSFANSHLKPEGKSAYWSEFHEWVVTHELQPISFFSGKLAEGKCNLANGVYDIKQDKLLPHDPSYGFTYCLPFDYDPNAKCPTYDAFILDSMENDQSRVDILNEFIGQTIANTPNSLFERCLILTGSGSNGKSVFLDTVKDVLGRNNCSAVRLSDMGNDQQRYSIIGKAANIPSEEKDAGLKDAAIIKAMISGESVQVKALYVQPFSTEINTKHIIACNSIPASSDTSDGLIRRFLIIPFNRKYTHSLGNIDINLRAKILPEISGVMNRFIEGYKRLMANGDFTQSSISMAVHEDYKLSANPVALWVDENITEHKTNSIAIQSLFDLYTYWCDRRGLFKPNMIKFGKDLRMIYPPENFIRIAENGKKISVIKNIKYNGEVPAGF